MLREISSRSSLKWQRSLGFAALARFGSTRWIWRRSLGMAAHVRAPEHHAGRRVVEPVPRELELVGVGLGREAADHEVVRLPKDALHRLREGTC